MDGPQIAHFSQSPDRLCLYRWLLVLQDSNERFDRPLISDSAEDRGRLDAGMLVALFESDDERLYGGLTIFSRASAACSRIFATSSLRAMMRCSVAIGPSAPSSLNSLFAKR